MRSSASHHRLLSILLNIFCIRQPRIQTVQMAIGCSFTIPQPCRQKERKVMNPGVPQVTAGNISSLLSIFLARLNLSRSSEGLLGSDDLRQPRTPGIFRNLCRNSKQLIRLSRWQAHQDTFQESGDTCASWRKCWLLCHWLLRSTLHPQPNGPHGTFTMSNVGLGRGDHHRLRPSHRLWDFGTLAKEMKFIAGIKYGLSSVSDCTLIPGGLNFSLTVKNEEKTDIIQSCGCVQPSPGHHRHHLTSGVVMFRVLGPVGVKRSNGFVWK